jgi:hypothetical protein
MKPFGEGAGHGFTSTQTGDENGEEELPIYECVDGCPVKALDEQGDDLKGVSRFFAQFEPDAPFFYCSKASVAEKKIEEDIEQHVSVKPLALMAYLVRLVTPKGGVVLDPYLGSGTTAAAAVLEGVDFIGIERHEPYVLRARARIAMAQRGELSLKGTRKSSAKLLSHTADVLEKAKGPLARATASAERILEVLGQPVYSEAVDLALSGEE